jgi:hypothetical protein
MISPHAPLFTSRLSATPDPASCWMWETTPLLRAALAAQSWKALRTASRWAPFSLEMNAIKTARLFQIHRIHACGFDTSGGPCHSSWIGGGTLTGPGPKGDKEA